MKLSLPQKLRLLCNIKNMKLQELAKMMDLSSQHIFYKLKENRFSMQDLEKLEKIFDADIEVVITLKDGTKI